MVRHLLISALLFVSTHSTAEEAAEVMLFGTFHFKDAGLDVVKVEDLKGDPFRATGYSFNRGMRSVYFTIAALTWLIGAIPLIIATVVTLTLIYRREFNSRTRQVLAR